MFERDEAMEALRNIDKCTADFSLRIPEVMDAAIKRLPKHKKPGLNDSVRLAIDRYLHEAEYRPGKYLKTGDD